ncbi:MAG: site-specific recombinase [Mesorhizobium sp.]|nr:MAG: site-specific recombinase [Mesorhizobium sp.]
MAFILDVWPMPRHEPKEGGVVKPMLGMSSFCHRAASPRQAGCCSSAPIDQLRALLRTPETIVNTWMVMRKDDSSITETEVREALVQLDPLWDELFPPEQARIVQLLVERVDVAVESISIRLRTEGMASLATELRQPPEHRRTA